MTATRSPKKTQAPKRRVPEFASVQEETEFWDTHDFTDYDGDWQPLTFERAPDFSHAIVVDLPVDALNALDQRAKRQGVGPAALAREWIVERLRAG